MSRFRRKAKTEPVFEEVVTTTEIIETPVEAPPAPAPEPAPAPKPKAKSKAAPSAPQKQPPKVVPSYGSGGVFRSIGGGKRIKL